MRRSHITSKVLQGLLLLVVWYASLGWASLPERRFHPDEAFFMTFARNASVGGDWWLLGALDKPPLTLYANALLLMGVGVDTFPDGVLTLDPVKGEFVGRLFSMFCWLALVSIMMRLAQRLYHRSGVPLLTGLALLWFTIRSPFIAAAFMDVPMVTLAYGALLCAINKRFFVSGLCFILAFSAKPQAIFFAPFLLGMLWAYGGRWHALWRLLLPILMGGACLLLWDALRDGTSVFALGASNNTEPFRFTLGFKLVWGEGASNDAWYWLNITFWVGLLPILWRKFARPHHTFFVGWMVAYVGLHALFSMRWYDRYGLIILPMLFLLGSWGLWQAMRYTPLLSQWQRIGGVMWVVVLGILLNTASIIPESKTPHILELANALNAKPIATVIYNRWYGWELGYYLGQWTNKRLTHYPTHQALIEDALLLPESGTRYFVAPNTSEADDWLSALRQARFGVSKEASFGGIDVYALTPPQSR